MTSHTAGPAPLQVDDDQPTEQDPSKTSTDRVKRKTIPIAATAALLGAWEAAVAVGLLDAVLFPPPTAIGSAFVDLVTDSYFYEHFWTTAFEAVVGLLVGCTLGTLVGVVLSYVRALRLAFYPHIITFQVVPMIVFAPLFITWLGFGVESKIAMTIAITFFPVLINTMLGLSDIDEQAIKLMRSLCASRRQMFTKLALRHALPAIFAGIRLAAAISLTGAIAAEFVSAQAGLGLLLATFTAQFQVDLVFAVTLSIAVLGLTLYSLALLVERRTVFWVDFSKGPTR